MRLYKYTCGVDDRIGVAMDADDAYARRAEVDPTFAYVDVQITELTIPGYEITIAPIGPSLDAFDGMERAELRAWLDSHNVQYVPQWGEQRLRETARAAAVN